MKLIFFLIFAFSINAFSVQCNDDQIDLNPGDVISADMMKDIFQRMSYISSGVTANDLNGIWQCRTTLADTGSFNGFSPNSDGMTSSMTQDVNFQKQSDDTFIITFPNYMHSAEVDGTTLSGGAYASGSNCKGVIIEGRILRLRHNGAGQTCALFNEQSEIWKLSKSCLVWEVKGVSGGNTTCERKSLSPLAPIGLTASVSGNNVNLSWTAGDSNTSSFLIKVKSSIKGNYVNLSSGSSNSYTDSLTSGTRWYRVFGVNSAGTGTGSNVVSVSIP